MPVEVGRHESAALTDVAWFGRVRGLPVSREEGAEEFEGLGRGYDAAGDAAVDADGTSAATEKNRFGPGMPHLAQLPKLGA